MRDILNGEGLKLRLRLGLRVVEKGYKLEFRFGYCSVFLLKRKEVIIVRMMLREICNEITKEKKAYTLIAALP